MNKIIMGLLLVIIIEIIACNNDNNDTQDNSTGIRGGTRSVFMFFSLQIISFLNKYVTKSLNNIFRF